MYARHPLRFRNSGFTLVEMLVVLAMTALLAALIVAVFGRVRENGRKSVCQNNLRQLVLAMQQYVQDADGRFPILPDLPFVLSSYTKSRALFHCPSDKTPLHQRFGSYTQSPAFLQMFGKHVGARHEATIIKTSTTIWLYEDLFFSEDETIEVKTPEDCGITQVGQRHFAGANHAFADGHVKWLPTAEFVGTICENARELPLKDSTSQ